jgi:hypothetical protein
VAKTTRKRTAPPTVGAKLALGKIVVRELTPRKAKSVKGGLAPGKCSSTKC